MPRTGRQHRRADILGAVRPAQTPALARRAAALSACSALLVLAACSPQQPKEFTGAKGEVAAVIDRFGTSATNDDGGRICRDLLTPELSRELAARAGGSCPNAVAKAIRASDFRDVRVDGVTIDGKGAAATVKASVPNTEDRRRTLYVGLTREGAKSDWRVADLAAPRPTSGATTP